MLPFNTLLTLAAAFAASVNGFAIRDAGKGVVSLDLAPKQVNKPVTPKPKVNSAGGNNFNVQQAAALPEPKLYSTGFSYLIKLGIGEKTDQVEVVFDTGSADLWVDQDALSDGGADFDSNNQPFSIGYGDGTTVQGTYGTSLIFFENGQEVSDVEWALGTNVQSTTGPLTGILGVGKTQNEASSTKYPNFTEQLKKNGLIQTNGYSYYLSTDGGKIIFGGKDNAKIKGSLVNVKKGSVSRFDSGIVDLISFGSNKVSLVLGIFDTGTTLTYLPESVIDALKVPGVKKDESYGSTTYTYVANPPAGLIAFTFNGLAIDIPLKDLSFAVTDSKGRPTGEYLFGFQPAGDINILGDTFLKRAYVVVDHDTDTVQIANVQLTSEEDIVAL